MNAALWIFATLVTEWACKTIWREYLEPWLVARSHAKAAADRAEEAEEREWFERAGVVTLTITPDTSRFDSAMARAQEALDNARRYELRRRADLFLSAPVTPGGIVEYRVGEASSE